MQSRIQWEQKERQILAAYATLSSQSKGRKHSEPVHVFRSEFQRDRDRIIHCSAFRRLEYKTQVVSKSHGDSFRTRLTHTIEVAAIARTTARSLGLNEDLAEAIALAHDLGHSPFGHAGEEVLNEMMAEHGGFEHNRQSLRVVEELEIKYPEFNGLNLSFEVRDGICRAHKAQGKGEEQTSLEAQITDIADEIAYCCHDLDDALSNELFDFDKLKKVDVWRELDEVVRRDYPNLDAERYQGYMIRCLIDHLVADLCQQSVRNIEDVKPADADAAQKVGRRLITFSPEMQAKVKQLRDFLYKNFYFSPKINRIKEKTRLVLKSLSQFYLKNPQLLGTRAALRIKKDGTARAVCDFIAGLTDRMAFQLHARHVGSADWMQELIPLEYR